MRVREPGGDLAGRSARCRRRCSGLPGASRSSSVPPGRYSSTMYRRPAVFAVVVEGADVRVRERGCRAGLALEAGRVGLGREQLDRDGAVELEILRGPDLGHAAGPEPVLEAVAAGDDLRVHGGSVCPRRGAADTRPGTGARPRAGRAPCRRRRSRSPRRRAAFSPRTRTAAGRPSAVPELGDGRLRPPLGRHAGDAAGRLPHRRRPPAPRSLAPGEAMGIATGGVVPDGADAVVQHELCCRAMTTTIEWPILLPQEPTFARWAATSSPEGSSSPRACSSAPRRSARSPRPGSPRWCAPAVRASPS